MIGLQLDESASHKTAANCVCVCVGGGGGGGGGATSKFLVAACFV